MNSSAVGSSLENRAGILKVAGQIPKGSTNESRVTYLLLIDRQKLGCTPSVSFSISDEPLNARHEKTADLEVNVHIFSVLLSLS